VVCIRKVWLPALLVAACVVAQPPYAAAQATGDSMPVAEMFSEESLRTVAISMMAEEESPKEETQVAPKSYRPYWIMVGWLAAATVYDVETTFYRLDRCQCIEVNPMVKPFVERGRLATYAYSAAVNGIIMVVARQMYNRSHGWWRAFPIAVSIVHGIAGTWNLYIAGNEET
jgi:hypothetical protein